MLAGRGGGGGEIPASASPGDGLEECRRPGRAGCGRSGRGREGRICGERRFQRVGGECPFLVEGKGDEGIGARPDGDLHLTEHGERGDVDPLEEGPCDEQGTLPGGLLGCCVGDGPVEGGEAFLQALGKIFRGGGGYRRQAVELELDRGGLVFDVEDAPVRGLGLGALLDGVDKPGYALPAIGDRGGEAFAPEGGVLGRAADQLGEIELFHHASRQEGDHAVLDNGGVDAARIAAGPLLPARIAAVAPFPEDRHGAAADPAPDEAGKWAAALVPGRDPEEPVSRYELIEILAARRFENPDWFVQLQAMNEANLLREVVTLLATSLLLDWERYRMDERRGALDAVSAAIGAEGMRRLPGLSEPASGVN